MDFINYMEPNYGEEEISAVNEYMNSGGWLTEFTKTKEFQDSVANYIGSKHCSIMSNGTVTLISALMACGVGNGDEVIVPDFTMSATAHAAAILGAKVVFADIEPDSLCMAYESMKKHITEKTKAVIIVDLNGRYSNSMQEIIDFCREKGIWIIEDAAQALGSNYKGTPLGGLGDIGSFSFSMPKIITTGQGGALVTNNDELFQKVLQIRDFGREKTGADHYISIGSNFKFTDLQAVIGIEQMKKLEKRIIRKKQIGQMYQKALSSLDQVQYVENGETISPCFYEILCENKEGLADYLKKNNIGTRFFYPPLHSEPAYGYKNEGFPISEEISRKGLWLPSSSKLTDQQIEYISEKIKEFYIKGV